MIFPNIFLLIPLRKNALKILILNVVLGFKFSGSMPMRILSKSEIPPFGDA